MISALILLLQRTTDNYDASIMFLLFKCNDADEALLFSTRVDWNQKREVKGDAEDVTQEATIPFHCIEGSFLLENEEQNVWLLLLIQFYTNNTIIINNNNNIDYNRDDKATPHKKERDDASVLISQVLLKAGEHIYVLIVLLQPSCVLILIPTSVLILFLSLSNCINDNNGIVLLLLLPGAKQPSLMAVRTDVITIIPGECKLITVSLIYLLSSSASSNANSIDDQWKDISVYLIDGECILIILSKLSNRTNDHGKKRSSKFSDCAERTEIITEGLSLLGIRSVLNSDNGNNNASVLILVLLSQLSICNRTVLNKANCYCVLMLLSELLNCINDNNQEVKNELEVVKKEVEVVTTRLLDWNCGSSKSTNKVMCTINHGVNSINNNNAWVEAFVLILLLHRNKSIDYYTIDKRRLLSVLIIQVLSNLIDSDNDNTNVSVLVLILLLKLSICTIRKENNRTGNDDVCDFALISLLDHTHKSKPSSIIKLY